MADEPLGPAPVGRPAEFMTTLGQCAACAADPTAAGAGRNRACEYVRVKALSNWTAEGGYIMAAFQTVTSYLNAAFSRDNIGQIVSKRELFAPGRSLARAWSSRRAPVFTPFGLSTLGSCPEASRKCCDLPSITHYRRNRRPPSSLPGLRAMTMSSQSGTRPIHLQPRAALRF